MESNLTRHSARNDNSQRGDEYTLVFCNPYQKRSWIYQCFSRLFQTKTFPMSSAIASDYFYRIFKIPKKATKSAGESPNFRDWLDAELETFLGPMNTRDQVQFPDFAEFVLKSIHRVLQYDLSLGIKEVYPSGNKDHVLFDLTASESVLKEEATRVCYRLQFKPNLEEESESYQSTPPYVVYQNGMDHEKSLKHYNGSLFNNMDRTRLISSILDTKIERSELYSLGILRSEEYLSRKYGEEDNEEVSIQEEEKHPIPKEKHSCFRKIWVSFRSADDKLRMTFGERTAFLYFWLSFYYLWWVLPGLIGLGVFLFDFILDYAQESHSSIDWSAGMEHKATYTYMAFAVFICMYSSLVVAMWIRKEKTLAWRWGMTDVSAVEIQRPQFIGEWDRDKVTGQMRKRRQSESRIIFKRAASFMFILILIAVDMGILALVFMYKATLKSNWKEFWGALLNAIQAQVLGFLYRYVAKWLNDWENIEFETTYYNNLCTKLFLFQFVNSYASLFYIAFEKSSVEGCIDGSCIYELNIQFLTIFFAFWGLNLLKILYSIIYPKIKHCFALKRFNRARTEVGEAPETSLNMTKAESQFTLMRHRDSPLHDHMDFVILYGYILMFSVCFPVASFLFTLTGILDVAIRLAKQLFLLNQPFPHSARSLGVWNKIIIFINVVAAFTNPAIVIFTAKTFDSWTTNDIWIIYMSISFGLLLCKLLVNAMLPAVPERVKLGLQWGNRAARERLLGEKEREPQRRELKKEYQEFPKQVLKLLKNPIPQQSSEESSEEIYPLNYC